ARRVAAGIELPDLLAAFSVDRILLAVPRTEVDDAAHHGRLAGHIGAGFEGPLDLQSPDGLRSELLFCWVVVGAGQIPAIERPVGRALSIHFAGLWLFRGKSRR